MSYCPKNAPAFNSHPVMVPKSFGWPCDMSKFSDKEKLARSTRLRFGKIKSKLFPLVIERMGEKCVYCQRKADVLDHVLPIRWGGTNDIENLQPVCSTCNSKKSGSLPGGL